MSPDHGDLVESLADRLVGFVNRPPTGEDSVVNYADPDTIRADFTSSVGLDFEAESPPHSAAALGAAAEAVLRWSVHTSHPRFINQNFAGPDPVGVMGDWLGSALNTTGSTYEVAPVFTLMERAVIDKLASLAGFPTTVNDTTPPAGLFSPGGSMATLYALQLARHRSNPELVERGDTDGPHAVFVSASGHYAAQKAAALLGIGTEAVIAVPHEADGSMEAAPLERAIDSTAASGRRPLAVIATSGTTVTAAFDPLPELADVCERRDLWLHVDGAYGGSALFSPTQRHRLQGIERADSLVWDLHKMMGMTQQCSVLLLRDPDQLTPCFAIGADYIFQPDKRNASLDSGDQTFQCGRRIDGLKLWLAWKAHGDSGFAARIDHAVALADHVRATIHNGDGRFAAIVAGDFTNVCLVWVPPELRPFDLAALDEATHARLHALAPRVKGRMQDEGTALMGYQPVLGINAFRLLFMNPTVTTADADALLALIDQYAVDAWDS